MLTEETIAKHKYFTTGAGDMWICRGIERVVRLERLHPVLIGAGGPHIEHVKLGFDESEKFLPVTLAGRPTDDDIVASQGAPARSAERRTRTAARKRPGPRGASGYKGVYPRKGKFIAAVTVDGKLKHLGTYVCRELAAAAVADEEGRTEDARRLRKIAAGQADNPPTAAEIAARAGYKAGSNDAAIA